MTAPRDLIDAIQVRRRLIEAIRVRLWLRRLERPVAERDLTPVWLFVGPLALYWLVGQLFHEFQLHGINNYLFSADNDRAFRDLVLAHRQPASGYSASAAHPLYVLLLHPIGSVLSRALGRSDLMAGLLICHVAAALGNVFLYRLLRRAGAGKALATGAAVVFALSTTQVAFGSIIETYSFVAAATLGLALLALRSTSPLLIAPAALFPFALNLTLAPYSLLCAPVVWLGRLRLARWARVTLVFLVVTVALGFGALLLQHLRYPETNFFNKDAYQGYYVDYVHVPKTAEWFRNRVHELVVSFAAFAVVAPRPFLIPGHDRTTTFEWDTLSTYSPLGWVVAIAWCALLLAATFANLRWLPRATRERRALLALCAGWMAGAFGLFFVFGHLMMLHAAFWTAHLVLWVGLGLDTLVKNVRLHRHARPIAIALVVLFALGQAQFVMTLVRNYHSGPLLTL
jgi:hypothetical protein